MTTAPVAPSRRRDALETVVAAVKPHLRGWLHAGMVPLALAAGIVLIALAPTTPSRIAATVFTRHAPGCSSAPPRSTTAATGRPGSPAS